MSRGRALQPLRALTTYHLLRSPLCRSLRRVDAVEGASP